jgi:hypothetical protein
MTLQSEKSGTQTQGWKICIFSLMLAVFGWAFSQISGPTPAETVKTNPYALENVSGTFKEQVRHLQENDKGPVLQWIERTRSESKIASHCVVLFKEKGSNADPIIPELAEFLRTAGYQVSTDSAQSKLPKELLGLRFEVQKNCVTVHIGII